MSNYSLNETMLEIISLFIKRGNNPLHGREIARTLQANQKTVQGNLVALEKAKILKKQQAGKTHLYSLNLEYIGVPLFLQMAELQRAMDLMGIFELRQIVQDLRKLTTAPMLVFGSWAKGYNTKGSDLDVLVLDSKKIKIGSIQHKYPTPIHLIQMSKSQFESGIRNHVSLPLEVLSNHILLQGIEYFVNQWVIYYGRN